MRMQRFYSHIPGKSYHAISKETVAIYGKSVLFKPVWSNNAEQAILL